MRKVLKLFGIFPLISLDFEGFEDVVLVEADDEPPSGITGGSGQNFEIDHDPLIAEDDGKDYDTWIQRPFGFQH